jgi:hypothetical protein
VRGEPTLSTAMTYRGDGLLLYTAWLQPSPALIVTCWFGRTTLAHVLVAQLHCLRSRPPRDRSIGRVVGARR